MWHTVTFMMWPMPCLASSQALSLTCIICRHGTYLFAVASFVFPRLCAFPVYLQSGFLLSFKVQLLHFCLPSLLSPLLSEVSMVHWAMPLGQHFVLPCCAAFTYLSHNTMHSLRIRTVLLIALSCHSRTNHWVFPLALLSSLIA